MTKHLAMALMLSLVATVAPAWLAAQQVPGNVSAEGEVDYYGIGKILAETDDWIVALDLWHAGKQELTARGRHDPRIGVEYLSLVAERRATDYYETASEIFAWGFSTGRFASFRETILAEARRIQPLLDEDEHEWHRWESMIDREDANLPWEIKRFWLERDPTPGTPNNERLIEHWERIAHARSSFANDPLGPYGADDRGTFYVKFGSLEGRRAGVPEADDFEPRLGILSRTPNPRETHLRLGRFDDRPGSEIGSLDGLDPGTENDQEQDLPAHVSVLSEYEGANRQVELVATATRLLSSENEPRVVITVLSSPPSVVEGVRALKRLELQDRAIRHTLVVRDEQLIEVGRVTERTSNEAGDISTFTLEHVPDRLHYTVLGEVLCCGEQPWEDQGLFPGQAALLPAEPLSPDPKRLEISDIVTGLPIPDEFDPRDLFFPLVPSRTIWRRDPLRVYLEAYHLEPSANGLHRFRADFRMARFEGDIELTGPESPPLTLSVDLESAETGSQWVFDIDVMDLALGYYRLKVTVTDLVSEESKTRIVPLTLLR